jgi:hypothetical protein
MLRAMRHALILLALSSSLASAQRTANKPEEPNFPTNDEIQLITTQADRAFGLYKDSLGRQEAFGLVALQSDTESFARERKLVELSRELLAGLRADPNKFHGLGGLLLLSGLDDASRNAALCSGQGLANVALDLTTKPDLKKARELLSVAESCASVSAHLYTVSESLHALLVREIVGQQIVTDKAIAVISQCMPNTKSTGTPPKGKP